MRRIALLVYDVTLTGGAEKVAINLANEFVKENETYLISVFMAKSIPNEIDSRVCCKEISLNVEEKIPFHFREYREKLECILRDNKIDILLSITAGIVTLAVGAAKRTRTIVLYCEHSNLENRTYGLKHVVRQYYGAKKADKVITLTERDRGNFVRIFKIQQEKVVVIPNWYTAIKEKRILYNSESKKIISVGRLAPIKGYEYILECAKNVLKENPDWQWDIYGDGPLREMLQMEIDSKDINRLSLKGNVPNVREKYSEYAFMVMTSYYEGLPLSLLEAQVAKLPIISFDSPTGPAEIIIDGVNGIIVPQFNQGKLEESVQMLISSKEKRKSFSAHAQDRLPFYSKERVLSLWNTLFSELLDGGISNDEGC